MMKHKTLLLLLLLSITLSVFGQDSIMIKDTCDKIHQLKNKDNIDSQLEIYSSQMKAYYLSSPSIIEGDSSRQAVLRYGYKFLRELKRSCQESILPISIPKSYLVDIEGKFNKDQIDSLEHTLESVSREKHIYIHVITIDDYYPYSSIEDFASKHRVYWGENTLFKDGTILVVISFAKREIRISTGQRAMLVLTNDKCTDVINLITPYFKQGKYFEGLITGLQDIHTKI